MMYPLINGLGDTAQSVAAIGSQVAGTGLAVTQAAISTGVLAVSGTVAAAIPIAGAVLAVGILVFSLLHNSRGLQQNVETTAAVNNAAELMQKNLDAWRASNKNLATQVKALQNFDDLWQAVVNFCSQASEGSPGQRCISERQRGGKYDFASYYRDPIENDPQAGVVDRQAELTGILPGSVTEILSKGGLILPVVLLAAAFLIGSDEKKAAA